MSESNRYQRVAIVIFGIALATFTLGFLADTVSRHWERVHESNASYQKNAEADRDKSADEIAETCRDRSSLEFRECVRSNLEAHYQNQATNEDLQAQQDMALWAFYMFIATVCSIAVSSIGVLLLIATIRQGKLGLERANDAVEAALEANQIMRDEQRPWLTIDAEELGVSSTDTVSVLAYRAVVENVGKLPAISVGLWSEVISSSEIKSITERIRDVADKIECGVSDGIGFVAHLGHGPYPVPQTSPIPEGFDWDEESLILVLGVGYRLFEQGGIGMEIRAFQRVWEPIDGDDNRHIFMSLESRTLIR